MGLLHETGQAERSADDDIQEVGRIDRYFETLHFMARSKRFNQQLNL